MAAVCGPPCRDAPELAKRLADWHAECAAALPRADRGLPVAKGLPLWLPRDPPPASEQPQTWAAFWESRGCPSAGARDSLRLQRAARASAGDALHVPLTMGWALPRLYPALCSGEGGPLRVRLDVVGAESEHRGLAKYFQLLRSIAPDPARPAAAELLFCGPELPGALHGRCAAVATGVRDAVAYVAAVDAGSPAAAAGVAAGDVVLRFGALRCPPRPAAQLPARAAREIAAAAASGGVLEVELQRGERRVVVRLAPQPGVPLGAALLPLRCHGHHSGTAAAPRVVVARYYRGKYEDYAGKAAAGRADAVFAFNSGIADFAADWRPAARAIAAQGVPACFTSYHAREARLDADTLRLLCGCPTTDDSPCENPFASPLAVPDAVGGPGAYRPSAFATFLPGGATSSDTMALRRPRKRRRSEGR
eukprot:TRINITY_DN10590_c0_g1_i1.p1 TRINITY_DN10590_c0_g1~~TRINITY_DN10590_c0_g1_i1.p1  ORF type:complete len:422 (+),score=50.07 TRINITY_DN10590_c0_g1_i1:63-1328(+)